MSNTMLLVTLLITSLTLTGAQTIGACYGRDGNNLPQPSEVVALYKSRGIGRMRIYDPNQGVLQALKGSNVELILGVPNSDLQALAADSAAASRWVQTNVVNYYPDVKIKYISVGNEVSPVNGNAQYVSFLVPAMTNVYNAILAAGLYGKVRVSTAFDTGVIGNSYPPSAAEFKQDIMWFLNPIIGFLTGTRAPLLVNIYTYFTVMYNPSIKLSYALFTNPSPEFIDSGNNLPYQNLFDAMLDGVYSALEKASGSSLEIVVSESGWPSSGGAATTLDNACTYNQNLIRHVKTGSPKKPGKPIETYLFSMFNENLKNPEFEKYFGLFYPNQAPVCNIDFFDQVSDM